MGSVFISHSWSDKPLARRIAETLRNFAIPVWLDEAEIKLGDSLIEKIRAGIDSVDYVLALLSKEAVASEWVKRELDIAMNQEIEGKKVKVLPILAGPCTLPGFLKGKLYADMSSSKKFKASLTLLLDRLGVAPSLLSEVSNGKSIEQITKSSKQALDIANALNSNDPVLQYKTLKSIGSYKYKEAISHPQVLQSLITFLSNEYQTHYRLEALRVIAILEDPNFADRVETLIDDNNTAVVNRTIETLAKLKAVQCAPQLFNILRNNQKSRLHTSCFNFFTNVELDDDADIVSLILLIENWKDQHPSDPGIELRAARVMCNQLNSGLDKVLERLLKYLESESPEVRINVLRAIEESAAGERLFLHRADVNTLLKQSLLQIFKNGTDTEIAVAWLTGLFWYEFDRQQVWHSVMTSRPSAIKAFISELEMGGYRLKYVFDSPDDVASLISLLKKIDEPTRKELADILAEICSKDAVKVLAEYEYEPEGWKAAYVLEGLAMLDEWSDEFEKILETAIFNSPKDNSVKALELLALLRAGKINLTKLIDEFPRQAISGYWGGEYDIINKLQMLKGTATPAQRRRLSNLIAVISRDES